MPGGTEIGTSPRGGRRARAAHLSALLVMVGLVAWLPQVARSEPAGGRPPVTVPAQPLDSLLPHSGVLFGAWVDLDGRWTGNADAQNEITAFESQIGRTLDIDHHYYSWTDAFPSGLEQWDLRNGRTPLITWKGTSLASINSGSYDAMIRSRANAVKALGGPVFLRWGWEMNGNWTEWGGAQNGGAAGGPERYVDAWRHIYRIFKQQDATNVSWVWAPNTEDSPSDPWNHWTNYYPGDEFVDWVGIDGFNWGTTHSWGTWRSLSQIIRPIYEDYAKRKPIMVAETGSVEEGGSKSVWLTGARRAVEDDFPAVGAFVYFDAHDTNTGSPSDFRVTTSAMAASAYRAWGEDPYFSPRGPGGGNKSPPALVGGTFVWPQPVKDSTQVAFTLSHAATVSIEIRDSAGIPVRHLVANRSFDAGTFAVTWDRKDDSKRKVPKGTYTAVVTATDPAGAGQSSQSFQAR